MKNQISTDEYNSIPVEDKMNYYLQYQEYISYQPGSENWNNISETKSTYTNNPIRKIYILISGNVIQP